MSEHFPDNAFLPMTPEDLKNLGWDGLDVILVTGDAYIDAPCIGVAVIGRILADMGYRVGVIAQPDLHTGADITRLGEPALFWGVTSGCIDSMIANVTAVGKRRKRDDLTPGGMNTKRPDRAVIVYANLIRRHFRATRPIVLGGVEASLRRISHYDAWTGLVRRSILFDAKADILAYGMAERTVLQIARRLKSGEELRTVPGICYISRDRPGPEPVFSGPDIDLPSHEEVSRDPEAFSRMFIRFHENTDPVTAGRLIQRQDTRYLVHNPPQPPLSVQELDAVHEFPYLRDAHPFHEKGGPVNALETIRFSITTHRGCYGECRFCAITAHQGRRVISRSEASIVREAARFARHPVFKGIIPDVGGPTANMYGIECGLKARKGACPDQGCLFPAVCNRLSVRHDRQVRLLERLRSLPGVRKVFIGSGIRYDLILADPEWGERYLEDLLRHHVSGQLKIAPEHVAGSVLRLMGKPGPESLEAFLRLFDKVRRKTHSRQFLTYYLMAAHPGCRLEDMAQLRRFARKTLRLLPQQVQIFTPSPSTFSTLMYHTGCDPFSGEKIFVEKSVKNKQRQKNEIVP